MSRPEKGDFQLSMGFIITVVFAVVLLTLALTWLRNFMGSIEGVGHDLFKEASAAIQDTFRSGKASKNGIYPSKFTMPPQDTLVMAAGIENTVPDALQHFFVINVVPVGAETSIISAKCGGTAMCAALEQEMDSWVTYQFKQSGPAPLNTGEFVAFDITYKPRGAMYGTYIFNVYTCKDVNSYLECDRNVDPSKLWGSLKSFTLEIKA